MRTSAALSRSGSNPNGPGLAFVGNAAVGINQIKSIWPARVGALGAVAKFIEHAGKFYAQLADAGAGDVGAFFFILRTGKNDLVFYIALHLPDVAGMGFRDIDHKKSHAILVLLVEFVEGRNLPPEWRSGVASENQHYGLLFVQDRKLDRSRSCRPSAR